MDSVRLIEAVTHGRVLVRTQSPSRFLFGFHGYLESAETEMRRLAEIPRAESWTLVSVQALHRVYSGRTQDVVASWMTRQDREEAIRDNIAYVDAVIQDVAGGAAAPLIVCSGFSQGGAMALRAATRGSARSHGVVAVGADVPPELLADRAVVFPRVLLARGARDEWMTEATFEADVAALRARNTDVQALVFDGGHEWTAEVSTAVGEFLRTLPHVARST